ncbi:MAG: hypothetical protein M3092_08395, partial [Actinomycetia bacterium]|nr:hypothetical protein [Actinomycetes bacterium]
MRRTLVIGATALAFSATAVIAWAGTAPVASTSSQPPAVVQGHVVGSVAEPTMEQQYGLWDWHADATHVVEQIQVADHDRIHEHIPFMDDGMIWRMDMARDRYMDHDATMNQNMDMNQNM